MDDKILKLLYDIEKAITEINGFFNDFPKSFDHYKRNILLKRAVEREFEIIGEAVNRILRIDNDFPIENARNIVGLRNQVIHAYDTISDENIYVILVKHLPRLEEEVQKLLKKHGR
ncbi:MAG: DUF86 domain-containing protein [Pricia sp.]